MTILHTRQFASWVRGHLLCRVEGVSDRFALTFDDGPSATATPRILDLLARHHAHATFFTLAPSVSRHPDLARRIVADGHEAGLHGDLHWPLWFASPGLIRREIQRSAAALAAATGARARHYRPAFGFMAPGQSRFVRNLGYVSVLGDVYPEDAQRPGTERIVTRVMPRLTGGSILILHDGSPLGDPNRDQTVAALAVILERAAERGLRAVTVAELIDGAPQKNGAPG